jgi:hypothetical protein
MMAKKHLSDSLAPLLGQTAASDDPIPLADAQLQQQLTPAQLQAVIDWLRAIAQAQEQQIPEFSQQLLAQASRLSHRARPATAVEAIVKGTLFCSQTQRAYLVMGDGQSYRQDLSQTPEPEPEPCPPSEVKAAYHSGQFTILVGEAFLTAWIAQQD